VNALNRRLLAGGKFFLCSPRVIPYNTAIAMENMLNQRLNDLGEAFLRLFYPAYCGICQKFLELEEQALCRTCQEHLMASRLSTDDFLLDAKHPPLREVWALFPYGDILETLIQNIKFKKKYYLFEALKPSLSSFAQTVLSEYTFDALVPIPLSRRKYIQREFNQSEVLANILSASCGIPVLHHLLVKHDFALSQNQLSFEERQMNIMGSFSVKRQPWIEGKKLLLIDDVFTTGATAKEAAHMLYEHGAQKVSAFALSFTVKNRITRKSTSLT